MRRELAGLIVGGSLIGGIVIDRVFLNDSGSETKTERPYSLQENKKVESRSPEFNSFMSLVGNYLNLEANKDFFNGLSTLRGEEQKSHFSVLRDKSDSSTRYYYGEWPDELKIYDQSRGESAIYFDAADIWIRTVEGKFGYFEDIAILARIKADGTLDSSKEGGRAKMSRGQMKRAILAFANVSNYPQLKDEDVWEYNRVPFDRNGFLRAEVADGDRATEFYIERNGFVRIKTYVPLKPGLVY